MSVSILALAVAGPDWCGLEGLVAQIQTLHLQMDRSVLRRDDRRRMSDLLRTLGARALDCARPETLVLEIGGAVTLIGPGELPVIAPERVRELARRADRDSESSNWFSTAASRGDAVILMPTPITRSPDTASAKGKGRRDSIVPPSPRDPGCRPGNLSETLLSAGTRPIPIGGQSHVALTRALHRAALLGSGQIRLAYSDGTLGGPMPLGVLCSGETPRDLPVLRAALISNRHLDLDLDVDVCIFRNAVLSTGASFGEVERVAAEITREMLVALGARPLELHVVQSGFVPTVAGLYRAILTWFAEGHGEGLVVVPQFRTASGTDAGAIWQRRS